jgi:hypothetical protein
MDGMTPLSVVAIVLQEIQLATTIYKIRMAMLLRIHRIVIDLGGRRVMT